MPALSPRKVIVDTGVDFEDIIVLLSAIGSGYSFLDVLLISVTSLDGQVAAGIDNIVKTLKLLPNGSDHVLLRTRPVLAIGCDQPLDDGSAAERYTSTVRRWQDVRNELTTQDSPLASRCASEEILQVLRDNEPQTVTILALAPLTTLAIAAAADPDTFLRAQEILVVGSIMSPAEIMGRAAKDNIYQDPIAAARLFALTSPTPSSTMPQTEQRYPEDLSSQLSILLFPQSSTYDYSISKTLLRKYTESKHASPLVEWIKVLEPRDDEQSRLRVPGAMAVNYAAASYDYEWSRAGGQDIRVQLTGNARGTYIRERSNIRDERKYDHGRWIDDKIGNRLSICSNDPPLTFGMMLLDKIFGPAPERVID